MWDGQNMKKRMGWVLNYLVACLPHWRGNLRAVPLPLPSTVLLAAIASFMIAWAFAFPAYYAFASEPSASSAPASVSSSAASSEEPSLLESEDNTVNARQTADNTFLYDTSIYELAQADASHQGTTVQVIGEVVGDVVNAEQDPDKCWITLEASEDEYESSISVLVNRDVLGIIDTYGGYGRTGTILQVRGTFYLACPSHEAIMDIHADSVAIVAKGVTTTSELNFADFKWGAILVGIGLALTLLYRYLRERER